MLVALVTPATRVKPLELPVEEAPRTRSPAMKLRKKEPQSRRASKEDRDIRILVFVLIALLAIVTVPLLLIVIRNPDFINSDISPRYDWTEWNASQRPDRLGP